MVPYIPELQGQMEMEVLRSKLNKRILDLVKNGQPHLKELADILGAIEFLSFDNKKNLWEFDVKGYIDREVEKSERFNLPESVTFTKSVILPPGEGGIIHGSGQSIETDVVPRTKYLLDLLSELKFDYRIITGRINKNMVRGRSYQIFIVPAIKKAILVNNSKNEATRVIHDYDNEDILNDLCAKTKEELDVLPNVEIIMYRGKKEDWANKMRESLSRISFRKEGTSLPTQEQRKKAPEGWETANGLKGDYKIKASIDTIKSKAEELGAGHPEWFRKYLAGNLVVEHYAPELVQKIVELFVNIPEGWKAPYQLAPSVINARRTSIKDQAELYRGSHPEWFMRKASGTEYISPELIQVLVADFSNRGETAPPGWLTASLILKYFRENNIRISPLTIKQTLNKYRDEHPYWFKYLRTRSKNALSIEHYSPELVAIVKDKLSTTRQEAPEGWITAHGLVEKLKSGGVVVSDEIIRFIAGHYSDKHPDWFRLYASKSISARNLIYFAPALVDAISKELQHHVRAPSGWITPGILKQKLGSEGVNIAGSSISKYAESYRNEKPEWFKFYIIGPKFSEHYSPELVKVIVEWAHNRKK